MKGVLLRSVLVAALSDGGKELMGFIDDFIHSGMLGRFKVRSTDGISVGSTKVNHCVYASAG